MVKIVVRALSPGIKDQFTAMNCIDKLSDALGFLSKRQLNKSNWPDQNDVDRVIAKPEFYHSIVNSCFNLIRKNAAGQEAVIIRMAVSVVRLISLKLPPRRHVEINDVLATLRGSFADPFNYEQDLLNFNQRCALAQCQL